MVASLDVDLAVVRDAVPREQLSKRHGRHVHRVVGASVATCNGAFERAPFVVVVTDPETGDSSPRRDADVQQLESSVGNLR